MGYVNVKELWYSLGCGPVLEDCLEPLSDDKGACHVVNIAMLNGEAHLYAIHMVCEPEYVLELEAVGTVEPQGVVEVQTETANDGVEAHVQADVEGQVEVEGEVEGHEDAEEDGVVESDNTDDDRDGYGDFGVFSMPKSMEQYKWEVGTYFLEKKDFIEAIKTYGVENGRKLKVYKNDKRRVRVKCSGAKGKCPWNAYCAYKTVEKTWQLRKIVDKHTCSREFNIRLMTSKWLSGRLEKTIKENPNINLYNIHNKVSKKWNIGVSPSTTCRAKTIAIKQIEGDFKEQYKRVYDYANELLRSNPGSTVKVHVEPNEETRIFKRLYVCLKACKDNFVSCRPIIGLDGSFLKGKYGGELLTAVARDGNDQMCPLAYAVVEVENEDNWGWFLELLIDDLGGVELSSKITYVSDQQKGLLPALQELLPGVEQRFSVRHIYANLRKRFPGQILKRLLWKAATSTHPQAWEATMREIKDVNPDAFKYLVTIPPRFWSRSRFTGQAICDTLVNNMSEAFNSVILHARGKPIITMMEEIRLYLMKRWATNRQKITTSESSLCPKIKNRFEKELQLTKYWIPSWSGLRIFEVRHTSMISEKYVVDIDKFECSCRKWTLTGIPCCHALAAMTFLNINGQDHVPHWFTKSTYQETYTPIIYPVNDPEIWEITSHPDVLPPPKRNKVAVFSKSDLSAHIGVFYKIRKKNNGVLDFKGDSKGTDCRRGDSCC
ncbi:uncharacterized protein LOC106763564 [Vigna radiata var. radiata]|uniref:Uncharacterized protein LOC106763564 n=1 Tax=Vigna radiata var. radiata TaxID=3916 RepID=A0A1S3UB21_VIGRR|nr:uncharacterized protein LOC106763564 [Vigna radiata var. radiata]